MTDFFPTLLVLGIVIGANNFAVALALGAIGQRNRQFRILLTFACFEFSIPLVGVFLGQQFSGLVVNHTHWLGPTLLAGLGAVTLVSARKSRHDREKLAAQVTTWKGLVSLSAGLSSDNLVVGFSMGLGNIAPLALATTIMCCSVLFSWFGLRIGHRISRDYSVIGAAVTGILLLVVAGAMFTGML